MNWCQRQRIDWIAEALKIYGFINRGHLMRKFGVGPAQAAKDLGLFRRHNPGAMLFNASMKRYETNGYREMK